MEGLPSFLVGAQSGVRRISSQARSLTRHRVFLWERRFRVGGGRPRRKPSRRTLVSDDGTNCVHIKKRGPGPLFACNMALFRSSESQDSLLFSLWWDSGGTEREMDVGWRMGCSCEIDTTRRYILLCFHKRRHIRISRIKGVQRESNVLP